MGSVNHVIFLVTLVNPRTFSVNGVAARRESATHVRHLDIAIELNHVFFELGVIKLRVAPVKPSLAIVINPNGRVNVIPVRACEMLSIARILERAFGLVCHGNVDSAATASRFYSHVVVILAIATNNLSSPVAVFLGIATKAFIREDEFAHIGPVHHIGGARDAPTVHGKEGTAFVVTRVHADGIAKHDRSRVRRIIRLDNRIFSKRIGRKTKSECEKYFTSHLHISPHFP